MTSTWPRYSLRELVTGGDITLGRGNIISKKDIASLPGSFPIYSSARENNGKFGEYGQFMFDEEMITWSIDGGGRLFYRPKHKFSVTNVGGTLRVQDPNKLSVKFLHSMLEVLHSRVNFDWVRKAHPSVIIDIYNDIPIPPLDEQKRIVAKLDDALGVVEALKGNTAQAKAELDALWQSAFAQAFSGNWPMVKLGDVCSYFNGKAHEQYVSENGKYKLVTSKFVSTEGKIFRRVVQNFSPLNNGDVVFVLSDLPNGKALGKAFLVNESNLFALNQRVIAVRSEVFLPKFLYYQLNRNSYFLSFDDGQKQTHLKLAQVLNCPLVCPSLDEQKRIVAKLDEIKSELDRQRDILVSKELETERLRSSILTAAFSGEL